MQTDVTIYYSKKLDRLSSDSVWVSDSHNPFESLARACKGMHYCNTAYILTQAGQGFTIPNNLEIPSLKAYLSALPGCDSSRSIAISHIVELEEVEVSVREELRIERCLDTVEKILNKKNLSRRDLHHLSPVLPGTGLGFSISNKTIKSQRVVYEYINVKNILCKEDEPLCIINPSDVTSPTTNLQVKCLNLQSYQLDGFCEWMNGLTLKGNRIIDPSGGGLDKEISELYTMEHEVIYEEHIMLNSSADYTISDEEMKSFSKSGNLWESFHINYKSLYWIIGSISGIIIGLLIIRCGIVCRRGKTKYRAAAQGSSFSRPPTAPAEDIQMVRLY